MRKIFIFVIATVLMVSGSAYALTPTGTSVTSDLRIGAVIHSEEKGQIEAVWVKGGEDTTSRGDKVVWGYFYADPNDVDWGSKNNPEVFVKIWFDAGGRIDVNFFHVSVPDIDVYSDYPYNGTYDEKGTTTLSRRYIRHYYESGTSNSDENYEDGNPPSEYSQSGNPTGYSTINSLRIGSVINTVELGGIEGVWQIGGQDTTSRGDQVVWGYFYASPFDVTWGSLNNPEVYVKIWFDVNGTAYVNFFHVSVPDIEVYSDLPNDSNYDNQGTTILDNRYIRHEYSYSGNGGAPPTEKDNASDLNILGVTAGVQWGAYADFLEIFSEGGTKALFGDTVDVGSDGSALSKSNYEKIYEIADALVKVQDDFESAIGSLDSKGTKSVSGFKLGLFATRLKASQFKGESSVKGILSSAWNFFNWGRNARINARKNIISIAGKLDSSGQQSIYQTAKEMWPNNPNIGNNKDEFFKNLMDSKLDDNASFLHNTLYHDPIDNPDYGDILRDIGKRPVDIVYEEGCKGLQAGVDLYVDAGKSILGGTLGDDFTDGYDKAEKVVDAINKAESAYKDPVDFIKGEVEAKIKDRIKSHLGDNTNLPDDIVDGIVDGIGDSVKEYSQHVTKTVKQETKDSDTVEQEIESEGWDWGSIILALATGAQQITEECTEGLLIWWQGENGGTKMIVKPAGVTDGEKIPVQPGTLNVDVLASDEEGDNKKVQANTQVKVTANEGIVIPVDFADTGTESMSLTAYASPADPGPNEGVTVTAIVYPVVEGTQIYFHIIGTDGYEDSSTVTVDSQGKATFYIPGGAKGVFDKVTIQVVGTGLVRHLHYTF